VDFAISTSFLGLIGGLVVLFTALGRIPPWVGYPLGGALLSIYLLAVAASLKSIRDFRKRPPPSASVVGRRGVVAEVEGGGRVLVKIEGVYWRAYCEDCMPGDSVEVVGLIDTGLVVRRRR
jgi:membrane protein implicated in regulation of membrane protease activity